MSKICLWHLSGLNPFSNPLYPKHSMLLPSCIQWVLAFLLLEVAQPSRVAIATLSVLFGHSFFLSLGCWTSKGFQAWKAQTWSKHSPYLPLPHAAELQPCKPPMHSQEWPSCLCGPAHCPSLILMGGLVILSLLPNLSTP